MIKKKRERKKEREKGKREIQRDKHTGFLARVSSKHGVKSNINEATFP